MAHSCCLEIGAVYVDLHDENENQCVFHFCHFFSAFEDPLLPNYFILIYFYELLMFSEYGIYKPFTIEASHGNISKANAIDIYHYRSLTWNSLSHSLNFWKQMYIFLGQTTLANAIYLCLLFFYLKLTLPYFHEYFKWWKI